MQTNNFKYKPFTVDYKSITYTLPKPPHMLTLTPDMQVFTRDVRRMLRYEKTRLMVGELGYRALSSLTIMTVKMFIRRGRNPRFMMAKLRRTVEKTLRSLERGMHGVSHKGLKQFINLTLHTNIMLAGTFHGRRYSECAICIARGSGAWWKASRCGHCFHVQCISTHFKYDTRCPLCRLKL